MIATGKILQIQVLDHVTMTSESFLSLDAGVSPPTYATVDSFCIAVKKRKLLPIPSNQKFNAYLQEIGDLCGIQKKLHHHLARKSFSVSIALANNVPVETLSRMLGHSSINVLGEPYCAYGYDMITDELRRNGFLINKKKAYRLMDENRLLMGKVIRSKGKRKWVTYRRIKAVRPMEYLCLDIKYVWVHGEGRWYYLLSIMDVFSRRILVHLFQKSIRKMDVVNLFRMLH